MKITVWERSTRRLSPSVKSPVQMPKRSLPESVAGLSNFVEEQEAEFQLSEWLAARASWVISGCRLAVPRYPGVTRSA